MVDDSVNKKQAPAPSSGKVEHDYHDFSHEEDPAALSEEQASAVDSRGEQNFPVKLHYMLAELEGDGLDHIVSWSPHGRCFVVHRQKDFVERVLPYWFRQTKFASFQRQLNLYGFKRITAGRDKGGYYHELFLRSKRFLSYRIQRLKVKGNGARKPSSPETEPDFYSYPCMPPSQFRKDKNGQHPGAGNPLTSMMAAQSRLGGMPMFDQRGVSLQQLLLAYSGGGPMGGPNVPVGGAFQTPQLFPPMMPGPPPHPMGDRVQPQMFMAPPQPVPPHQQQRMEQPFRPVQKFW